MARFDGSVRSLSEDDRLTWEPLWAGYNAFYDRPAVPASLTATTWSRLMDPAIPMHVLGAFHDAELLGITQFLFHPSTTALGDSCYLQDLFTVPEARGAGVGRALIEAVYAQAERVRAARVYWQTHKTNLTGMRLYDQLAEQSDFIGYVKKL